MKNPVKYFLYFFIIFIISLFIQYFFGYEITIIFFSILTILVYFILRNIHGGFWKDSIPSIFLIILIVSTLIFGYINQPEIGLYVYKLNPMSSRVDIFSGEFFKGNFSNMILRDSVDGKNIVLYKNWKDDKYKNDKLISGENFEIGGDLSKECVANNLDSTIYNFRLENLKEDLASSVSITVGTNTDQFEFTPIPGILHSITKNYIQSGFSMELKNIKKEGSKLVGSVCGLQENFVNNIDCTYEFKGKIKDCLIAQFNTDMVILPKPPKGKDYSITANTKEDSFTFLIPNEDYEGEMRCYEWNSEKGNEGFDRIACGKPFIE